MGRNRPTTRSSNKRTRHDDNAEDVLETYRKILSTEQVCEDDVNQLYMIWKPVCQGCRVNTKDNPNCFCALAPPLNGSRKSGLWQKTSEIVNSLGPDPSKDLRESPHLPAGLTNLGATCYANSILQCLYMNKSFRAGVFSVEPDVLKQQPVLNQLARLFAQLHSSKMTVVDSAPFILKLELDNAVQQDSHEFLTLLFSLLEQCLRHSKVSKAKTMVQDLFRGGVSHVTVCSKCGNQSEASSKTEDFYELELNIKGLKSLDESLDDYLSPEELKGDNQYFCASCATRVNATRRIMLRSLPPVLNFQLKRCIFLPNTTMKKKITSPFSFPQQLNMERRLSESSQCGYVYDLSAVLIHKGPAVNSGHYIAHIKDESTEQWWEFDDEQVLSLGEQPNDMASSCDAKLSQTENIDQSSSLGTIEVFSGKNTDMSQLQSLDSRRIDEVKTFTSSDAYMLMYVRRVSKKILSSQKVENGASDCSQDFDISLPPHLVDDVEELNANYLNSCKQYKEKKDFEINRIMEQRNEVRTVLAKAPVHSLDEKCFWISAEWLRQWSDSIVAVNIDNTSIQCLHGKVPVTKVNIMKRLSPAAWSMLLSKYDGGPTLGKDDYCIDCLLEVARSVVRADNYRDKRMLMREMAVAALSGKCYDDKLYYVSKAWLQHWLRKKNVDAPSEADAGPTALIRCEHGRLLPEQADGAKRVLIPETLWHFFHQSALVIKPDDVKGCATFISDSEPCAECSTKVTNDASLEDNLREYKCRQKQIHEKLASGRSIAIEPRSRYYLLPSSWLSEWKTYINSTTKNTIASEPEKLDSIMDSLVCEKHARLVERPPDLIYRRGMILQKTPNTDALSIIPEDEWRLFCEDWGGVEAKGIVAEVVTNVCLEEDLLGSCKEIPPSEANTNVNDEENNGESQRPILRTTPGVCEECIGERESCELVRKLNYSSEDICVYFVRGKDPPKSLLKETANLLEPNRRTSKRSRKTNFGNSIRFNVSSFTSIYQLKMMIWEAFGIVKENQVLHKGSKVIHEESTCLGELSIFPGDTLWVTDSEIHENRDIADELSDQKMDAEMMEEGFRGTLLTSNVSELVQSNRA